MHQNEQPFYKRIWNSLTCGTKLLFLLNTTFLVTSFLTFRPAYYLTNNLSFTLFRFQLWRIFTSFLIIGTQINGLINLYLCYMILYKLLPQIEQKLSTAYLLTQFALQIVMQNVLYAILGGLITLFLDDSIQFNIFGLFGIIIIFICKNAALDPEGLSKFCFFPCVIKQKYSPILFTLIFALFGDLLISLIACSLGYLQFFYLRKSLIQLPMRYYHFLDDHLPKLITQRNDYRTVNDVEHNLKLQCGKCWSSAQGPEIFVNPFAHRDNSANNQTGAVRNNQERGGNKVSKDQVIRGNGVLIGGHGPELIQGRNYWNMNDIDATDTIHKNQPQNNSLQTVNEELSSEKFDKNNQKKPIIH